ncbi:MAG: HEAT repeat domain-containing protein [Gillisia sp.]
MTLNLVLLFEGFSNFRDWAWIMKINVLIILFFLFLTLCLVTFIIGVRLFKNFRNSKKKKQENLLIDFLNSFLFDEDFEKQKEIENFKQNHLNTKLEIKVTIKEILQFHKNLKGESATALEELFLQFQLDVFILKDLEKNSWYNTARAIYALSELTIKVPVNKIEPYLNDPRDEVRQQSQLYFLKTAKSNPLQFLDKTKRPLTTWQQIYIENALKNFYEGPTPDFAQWLNHELISVVEFTIRLISRYNQFENIPKLLPFLDHDKESVKIETIRSLRKLGYEELLGLITPGFEKENLLIKKEILKTIQQLGDYNELQKIRPLIAADEWELKINYLNIERFFLPEETERINIASMIEKEIEI